MKADRILWLMVLGLFGTLVTLSAALAAYSSHQNDQDVDNFSSSLSVRQVHQA